MRKSRNRIRTIGLVLIVFGGWLLFQKYRSPILLRELASIVPQIKTIQLYDIDSGKLEALNVFTNATSTSFPVDVFRRAAVSASHQNGPSIWKGSSLGVLNLKDGTHRYVRLGYFGGTFAIDGCGGQFVASGGDSSELQTTLHGIIQRDFIPKRHERIKEVTPAK